MKKIYKAGPQYIGRNVPMNGSNSNVLYELEELLSKAIIAVVEWRSKHMKEDYWTHALPMTILTMLNAFDKNAATVAAKSFLSGNDEEIES